MLPRVPSGSTAVEDEGAVALPRLRLAGPSAMWSTNLRSANCVCLSAPFALATASATALRRSPLAAARSRAVNAGVRACAHHRRRTSGVKQANFETAGTAAPHNSSSRMVLSIAAGSTSPW